MSAIPIPIDPTAIRIGPLVLAWHGIFTSLGILTGLYLAAYLAPRVHITADDVWNSVWWVVLGGLAGARLLYAGEHAPAFAADPLRILFINEGGISVSGAVLGGMVGGAWWARRNGVSPARLLDVVGPGFLIGQAVGRIGDIINGEHWGTPADGLPWAVVYTHPDTLGEIGVPVHPAVAYELLWDTAGAAALVWVLRGRQIPPGVALTATLAWYGLGRFWVGFFRQDQHVIPGLGLAQLIGITMLPIALLGMWLAFRRRVA